MFAIGTEDRVPKITEFRVSFAIDYDRKPLVQKSGIESALSIGAEVNFRAPFCLVITGVNVIAMPANRPCVLRINLTIYQHHPPFVLRGCKSQPLTIRAKNKT